MDAPINPSQLEYVVTVFPRRNHDLQFRLTVSTWRGVSYCELTMEGNASPSTSHDRVSSITPEVLAPFLGYLERLFDNSSASNEGEEETGIQESNNDAQQSSNNDAQQSSNNDAQQSSSSYLTEIGAWTSTEETTIHDELNEEDLVDSPDMEDGGSE